MQVRDERSTGQAPACDRHDDLLQCRMNILGLDRCTMERDFGDTFGKIERRCVSCRLRMLCAVDLKRNHNSLVWEAYCPNSGVLNALVALTEVNAVY